MPQHRTLRSLARPLAVLAALLLGLVALVGPGVAQADEGTSAGVPPGKAWVRVGHFVPGMGATSIELTPLDGSADPISLAGDATYGQVSSYEKLPPGSYTATVTETSAPADSTPLLSRSFEVTSGEARTVAVIGTSDAPRLVLLTDDLTPPAPGTARVRLLSASEAADTVTVKAVDGPIIAEGATLGQATAYKTVPAGSWTLQLQSDMADATVQDVPIASGSVYTVVALDAGNQDVKLQVVTDAAGAMVAPQGGAKTGLGGTAPRLADAGDNGGADLTGTLSVLALALAAAGAATVVVRRRRLTATAR